MYEGESSMSSSMNSLDQCHSTVGESPAQKARVAGLAQVGVTGQRYYRGLDDVADTGAFRDWLEREFPEGASRLLESSRRTFLKLMGASVALAGAATLPGCRRPDHKIYSFSRNVPEEIIPGKSLYYATSLYLPGGRVESVLCETHEGRPTKIEGNPLHPGNQGKTSPWAQAAILSLYDPDRLKDPVYTKLDASPRSWADFAAWLQGEDFKKLEASQGAGLAIVVDKRRSPTRSAVKGRLLERFPKAMWVAYDPTETDEVVQGAMIAFGKPVREVLHLEKADVVVSLDRDFLFDDPGMVRNTRGFSARRQVLGVNSAMSRLYVFESGFSVTGAKADHRVALPPSHIPAAAVAIARRVLDQVGAKGAPPLRDALKRAEASLPSAVKIDEAFIDAVAKDLLMDESGASRATKTVLVAGPTQPAVVHALCHAVNAALGNIDNTVTFRPMSQDEGSSGIAGLRALTQALNDGKVSTLVTIGVNPVYDAPADLNFAQAMSKASVRIAADLEETETVRAARWRLPLAHDLESWGDLESLEGVVCAQQPMIAPLYGAKSDIEILALLTGAKLDEADGHELVQATWRDHPARGRQPVETFWKRALNSGILATLDRSPMNSAQVGMNLVDSVSRMSMNAVMGQNVDVVFTVGMVGDGSLNNNAWLQELPDPLTKIVWDNVAVMNKATAARFGLEQELETNKVQHARMCRLTVGDKSVDVPAWVAPGVADNTVLVHVGYGRSSIGSVGEGTGFNVFPIAGVNTGSGKSSRRVAFGATLARGGGSKDVPEWYAISTTQQHGSMEGRAIVREVDLPAWRAFGDKIETNLDAYRQERKLVFAERLGELAHAPANVNAYINPQRGTKDAPTQDGTGPNTTGEHGSAAWGKTNVDSTGKTRAPDFATGPQWGMSIDLTTCTGCSACTIACQAENNIPVVGKIETRKGREMHWIRVDRYYAGEGSGGVDAGSAMFQPVACVHCENAPCETVCPVNATVHGPEGINYMVYNRCIGTRYCANNCPYKVRRFNFFDYGVKKLNGEYIGESTLEAVGADPANVNLIPPRLRQRLDEISKLGMNPNVTVRSRGVMEKCTYCIQRINEARVEVKLKNLPMIPDGFVQTACQQACPADAIVFGDLLDTKNVYPTPDGKQRTGSLVRSLRDHGRSYLLLGFLNTRPRTTYLAGIRNPNPALVSAERKKLWENPFGHGHEGGHEGHDHEGGHGGEGHGSQQHGLLNGSHNGSHRTNQFDPSRAVADSGYRLSLGVLS